jgi:hypothetical protein
MRSGLTLNLGEHLLSIRPAFWSLALVFICSLAVAQAPPGGAAGDEPNGVFVDSSDGHRIRMADLDHCIEAVTATDGETVGCLVSRGLGNLGFVPQLQIEVYWTGGHKLVLTPGGPILDWRFWKEGTQVAVSFESGPGRIVYALFNGQTGELIERIPEPKDHSTLPQWAKSQTQIEDESVPIGPTFDDDRRKWLSKVMGQIATIKPGMHRQDLFELFHKDGGLSSGWERRYVFRECPAIKINVRFKPTGDGHHWLQEDPDDVIESVSKPYLEYPFAD